MTKGTNMEHVEVLQAMLVDEYPEGSDDGSPTFTLERAALTAAIASLSAPQPPAEAQTMPDWGAAPPGATHYQPHQDAYYKRVSASEWYVWSRVEDRELLRWLPSPGTSDSAEWVVRPTDAHPPPSAPVGVEAIIEAFDEITGLCRHLRQGGPDPEDLQELSDALVEAIGIAGNMLAALAQQPAAEAQVVAWEWGYVGNDPYPRGKTVARALHEMDPQNPPYPETWRPTRPLVYGDASPQQPPAEAQPVAWQFQDRKGNWHEFTDEQHRLNTIEDGSWPIRALYAHPPPSAPVGVEGLPERWRREAPQAKVDSGEDAACAYREAVYWCAFQLEEALAQQPVDGEEIMVNAVHDVYTLPLQPSGLLSGPRFVVHVPGPEQPEAVDDEPVAWPLASPEEADKGWTLDYRFIEQVDRIASQRTDYTTSMEATEQVLIAANEVLRVSQPAAQQPAAVAPVGVEAEPKPEARGVVDVDAWRALWLVLRQTGTTTVPLYDIVSADWSKCQIEQTEQQLTGAVQLRATLLPTKHQEPTDDR